MIGLGTIVNTAAIIAGGLVGCVFKSRLSGRFQHILMQACGLSVIFIGASGALQRLFRVGADGTLTTQGTMLLIISLVLGGLIGEAFRLEERMEQLGERLRHMVRSREDSNFVSGFVNTSLIVCVGAMAIVGSIQDGLTGDSSMLLAKALLDFVIVMVMASTYGVGAVFSSLAVFVYQGLITLIAVLAGAVISDRLISELSCVGAALVFCVGIDIVFGSRFKTASLLPAILIPVLYTFLYTMFPALA